MFRSFQFNQLELMNLSRYWGWLIAFGLILIVLGGLAISMVTLTTVISMVFLGFLVLLGSFVLLVDAFHFWRVKWSGFFIHLILGLLYFFVGWMLIQQPMIASISITLFLGLFYTIVGLYRIIFTASLRLPQWGWSMVSGLISALLGILILSNWPWSGEFIIGLFIGIDLIFGGWAYLITGITAKALLRHKSEI